MGQPRSIEELVRVVLDEIGHLKAAISAYHALGNGCQELQTGAWYIRLLRRCLKLPERPWSSKVLLGPIDRGKYPGDAYAFMLPHRHDIVDPLSLTKKPMRCPTVVPPNHLFELTFFHALDIAPFQSGAIYVQHHSRDKILGPDDTSVKHHDLSFQNPLPHDKAKKPEADVSTSPVLRGLALAEARHKPPLPTWPNETYQRSLISKTKFSLMRGLHSPDGYDYGVRDGRAVFRESTRNNTFTSLYDMEDVHLMVGITEYAAVCFLHCCNTTIVLLWRAFISTYCNVLDPDFPDQPDGYPTHPTQ